MSKSPVDNRIPGHDSMVTVRLSEPPSLSVNTDLPAAVMPSRRSILGPECTPTSAVTLCESEGNPEEVKDKTELEMSAETPTTTTNDETKSNIDILTQDNSTYDQDGTEESDTEEVNWEALQKTENEQVKEQDDNVRMPTRHREPISDTGTSSVHSDAPSKTRTREQYARYEP